MFLVWSVKRYQWIKVKKNVDVVYSLGTRLRSTPTYVIFGFIYPENVWKIR